MKYQKYVAIAFIVASIILLTSCKRWPTTYAGTEESSNKPKYTAVEIDKNKSPVP